LNPPGFKTFAFKWVNLYRYNGDLEMLHWAWDHLEHLPYDQRSYYFHSVCLQAAKSGFLDVLRWARSRGCFWNCRTLVAAALEGHDDVFTWARDNGGAIK
jgi:hypothetical protein